MEDMEQIKLIHSSWMMLWQTYITWFTWHFGIQMVILGGIFQFDNIQPIAGRVSAFCFCLTLLAIGASGFMIAYESELLNRLNELGIAKDSSVIFGGSLTLYASKATLATNVFLASAWAHIFWTRETLFHDVRRSKNSSAG